MMRRLSAFLLTALLAAPAIGQDVVLPDLAPRVVEITGDLSISFPSLDRQPLVGFNPPPRVPEIPMSRSPYTEEYKQSKRDLPQSPLQEPEAPAMSGILNRPPQRGIAEAGVGRYLERFARVQLSAPIDASTTFFASGRYHATDGYEPFSDRSEVNTSRKHEYLSLGLARSLGPLEARGKAGFDRYAYSLFGAEPVAVSPALYDPHRKVQRTHATARLDASPGSAVTGGVSATAEHTSVATDLYKPVVSDNPTVDRTEDRLLLDGAFGFPVSDVRLETDGHVSFQGLDVKGFPGRTVTSGSASGRLAFEAAYALEVEAGLRYLAFSALGQADNGGDRKVAFLSPDFKLTYGLSPGLELTASNRPEVSRESTFDLYYLSPYTEDRPAIQPVLTPIDFRVGLRTEGEFIQAGAEMGWKDVKNYRFIESSPVPVNGFGAGFLSLDYDEASIVFVNAHAGAALAPGIQATLEVTFQRGELGRNDTVIPYFSPVVSTATVLASLLSDRLLLKFQARGEASRFVDREETAKVGSLLLFDLEGTYYLTSQAALVVGIRDLGSSAEFWQNYTAETTVFYTGAKWRW